jgi:hypothetical protein
MMPVAERGGARSAIGIARDPRAGLLWLSFALCGCVAADAPGSIDMATAKLDIVDGEIWCGELADGPEATFNMAVKSTDGEPVLIADLNNKGPQKAFSMVAGKVIDIDGVDVADGIRSSENWRRTISVGTTTLRLSPGNDSESLGICFYDFPRIAIGETGDLSDFRRVFKTVFFLNHVFKWFPSGISETGWCLGNEAHYVAPEEPPESPGSIRWVGFTGHARNDSDLQIQVWFSMIEDPEITVSTKISRRLSIIKSCVAGKNLFYCSFDSRMPASFISFSPTGETKCKDEKVFGIRSSEIDSIFRQKQKSFRSTPFRAHDFREYIKSVEDILITNQTQKFLTKE